MKLEIVSDLHFEIIDRMHKNVIEQVLSIFKGGEDTVLIIAGDFGKFNSVVHMAILREICYLYKQVLFVAGNHEYYGNTKEQTEKYIKEFESTVSNFKFLNNELYTFEGQKFIGGTLWFYNYNPVLSLNFSDFACIKGGLGSWVKNSNAEFKKVLNSYCDPDTIVISHHSCSEKSIHPRFFNSMYNCFFCDPLDKNIVLDWKPKLWIHGHTHDPLNYVLGQTNIICNPLGYPNEYRNDFQTVKVDI